MDDFIEYMKFIKHENLDEIGFGNGILSLQNDVRIQEIIKKQNVLIIGFNKYVISDQELIEIMSPFGFVPLKENENIGSIAKWVKKLANKNTENLGNKRLDCCDMNTNKGN